MPQKSPRDPHLPFRPAKGFPESACNFHETESDTQDRPRTKPRVERARVQVRNEVLKPVCRLPLGKTSLPRF